MPPNQHWGRCLQGVLGPLAYLPKAIVLLMLLSAPAYAETLREALAMAYRTSPVLHGQQALQRATAEGAVQARSALLPQVSLDASAGYIREPYDTVNYAAGTVDSNDTAANLTVSQNLYSFGRIGSAVRAALARAAAGEQGVRVTERHTQSRSGHADAPGGEHHIALQPRRGRDPHRCRSGANPAGCRPRGPGRGTGAAGCKPRGICRRDRRATWQPCAARFIAGAAAQPA
jgi:hypothetical protein